MAFVRDVKALNGAFEGMGNPFCENSSDLLIANGAVADMVYQIEELGLNQYEAYVEERLVSRTVPISSPSSSSSADLQSE
jgi:hypothetical protein